MRPTGYPSFDVAPRPPVSLSPEDEDRWAENARRRAMLEGRWKSQLDDRIQKLVGTARRDAWGETSLAINPFSNISRELSVLYDTAPDIRHDTAETDGITGKFRTAGIWPMMQMVQYYVLGQNDGLVRLDASPDGRLTARPAFADLTVCTADPDRPDLPVSVREYRQRKVEGAVLWTCDHLDVTDLENPVYRVTTLRNEGGQTKEEDATALILGAEMSGDAYPYRRRNGLPVLPYVKYHARKSGFRLWSPYDRMELVEGTLDAAVLHQMLMHTWRDASWPQRYTVNLEVGGAHATQTSDGRPAGSMVTDPASLLQLVSPADREENTQPMVGQFKPGGDIAVMERSLADFVARLAQSADVPPSDIQRMTGQAQSGAAISLTNEGKRAAQKRYAESFRDSDERLVMTAAILLNRATATGPRPTNFVEGGYRVVYREIPVSPQEREARRKEALEMLAAGLLGPVAAYRVVYPEATEEDAARAIGAPMTAGEE